VRERLGKLPAGADLLAFRNEAGQWLAVLDQHEAAVLVMHAIDAVREIPRRLRDRDGRVFHRIRLSDFSSKSTFAAGARPNPRRRADVQRWKSFDSN
jgi:hypothetical protein